jgi:hypothetical protein
MKRIFFFATRNDILSITDSVESGQTLKYILAHHNLHPKYRNGAPIYNSAHEIPDFGIAAAGQTNRCERYLIVDESVDVLPVSRLVGENLPDGGAWITAYEAGNCSQCVQLNAGGFWNSEVLINGLVQTWSDSAEAQRLMRRFASAVRRQFATKIGEYWIGREAFEFLKRGGRLTLNVAAASSFDVKLPV